ncbi:MAG: hypothetical protein A2Y62_15720 [Candidatus Fischerbacteria bacterium RBG_13_37_8]|uniref:DUF4846 domain-containing protein n=1 Tax=Candidatus Fischerbacteria bacterium RBG_13_37_8 TaxID=1817863 RepID=A0A1F5VW72_9BACT|nr:MAG: hypothetical protein A2Y62_15720 [Candidatus Fischerbacteria bacterium RBG_13_37_8]
MVILSITLLSALCIRAQENVYSWLQNYEPAESAAKRIEVPEGYERVAVSASTFAEWLRNLPLKENNPPVYLYNGNKKYNQEAHFAVINIDVGTTNLQQCADAVMRLRAEYLYSQQKYDDIHFNFTSGDTSYYSKWREGIRPVIKGNKVTWVKSQQHDVSYGNFRKYLTNLFIYAGSYSLGKELIPVSNCHDMKIGDVFIQGGFPGHAVIVIDMAQHKNTSKKIFLLAQSYMPAQDIHILKNPNNSVLNPWYDIDFGEQLHTPEWTFHRNHLKHFP